MIIEHSFVTTLAINDAFQAADQTLASLGFASAPATSVASREWRRGAVIVRKTWGQADLPQRIRIDFDRGRISVAGSVQQRHKKQTQAGEALVAVASAIENRLAHNQPADQATAAARATQAQIARRDRRHKIAMLSLLFLFLSPIFAGIAFAIYEAASGSARTHASAPSPVRHFADPPTTAPGKRPFRGSITVTRQPAPPSASTP